MAPLTPIDDNSDDVDMGSGLGGPASGGPSVAGMGATGQGEAQMGFQLGVPLRKVDERGVKLGDEEGHVQGRLVPGQRHQRFDMIFPRLISVCMSVCLFMPLLSRNPTKHLLQESGLAPEAILHWGHGAAMATVFFAMCGYGLPHVGKRFAEDYHWTEKCYITSRYFSELIMSDVM